MGRLQIAPLRDVPVISQNQRGAAERKGARVVNNLDVRFDQFRRGIRSEDWPLLRRDRYSPHQFT